MGKIRIVTYGCAVNKADSEIMAGLLSGQGFEIADDPEADVIIVNTCIVKTPTENKILKYLDELKSHEGKVIVAGCMPHAIPEVAERFPDFSFIGINTLDVGKAVESAVRGDRFVRITGDVKEKICGAKLRHNPIVEIVPIAEGCAGSCTYCQVKLARGNLHSYQPDLILERIKDAVSDGAKEIWITAQDTGAYGADTGYSLPGLLNDITGIDGDFYVRVGMMNPNHVLGFLEELIRVYKNNKIYKFLHIPVQSGDDSVLGDMGRKYSAEDFREIVKRFRREIEGITVSTDVIAGFPTEDEDAFRSSINLIREVKPDILNISRYWERKHTEASRRYINPPGRITKKRSREMTVVFQEIGLQRNREWIGWKGKALVSEQSNGSFTARNFAYKPIVLKDDGISAGEAVDVEITDATYYDLRGRCC